MFKLVFCLILFTSALVYFITSMEFVRKQNIGKGAMLFLQVCMFWAVLLSGFGIVSIHSLLGGGPI